MIKKKIRVSNIFLVTIHESENVVVILGKKRKKIAGYLVGTQHLQQIVQPLAAAAINSSIA